MKSNFQTKKYLVKKIKKNKNDLPLAHKSEFLHVSEL